MKLFKRWALIVVAVVGFIAPVYAENVSILGAWKLISFAREDAVSGETIRPWGNAPSGYLMYLPDGHMSAVLTAARRGSGYRVLLLSPGIAGCDKRICSEEHDHQSVQTSYAHDYLPY